MRPCTHASTRHTQHKFRLYPCTHTNTYTFHTYILRHIYHITLIHSHIHRYVSLYMYRQTFTYFTGSGHTRHTSEMHAYISLLSCIHHGKSVQAHITQHVFYRYRYHRDTSIICLYTVNTPTRTDTNLMQPHLHTLRMLPLHAQEYSVCITLHTRLSHTPSTLPQHRPQQESSDFQKVISTICS